MVDQVAVVREVLPGVARRFVGLVRRLPADARATAEWTVADTAAHVASITTMYTSILAPGGGPVPFKALVEPVRTVTVDTVADLNVMALRHFTNRDPQTLTDGLLSDVDTILKITDGTDHDRTVPWLGDSRVPVGGVLAHLVNELLVHGWDIARAQRVPWTTPPREAAPFFALFLVGMIRNGTGSLLDGPPPSDRRIAVAFRSRYTDPVTLVLHGDRVTAEDGPADVTVRFDPAALNLMMFGRVSRARTALTGKVVVSGRRPWLLPAFLRKVRLPTNARPLS
ncbi:maleylpyruvate isomerase family mycothiol-dependent enzyme [Saccharothrix mutabilis subsp. mutabilis]|uniref:Maleylpyruvate isomerase family mycothiol-dependent enzyme n=1 Tax=Saccharothrix mutabilis subsp. mutabilis TaxID=66855 RepID=A0ABN0UMV4_9PSEU